MSRKLCWWLCVSIIYSFDAITYARSKRLCWDALNLSCPELHNTFDLVEVWWFAAIWPFVIKMFRFTDRAASSIGPKLQGHEVKNEAGSTSRISMPISRWHQARFSISEYDSRVCFVSQTTLLVVVLQCWAAKHNLTFRQGEKSDVVGANQILHNLYWFIVHLVLHYRIPLNGTIHFRQSLFVQ